MTFHLGIDLGTTFTGVAVARDGGPGAMVSLGRHRYVTPTAVWIGGDSEEPAVGESALRRLSSDPGNVVTLFKRTVGSDVPLWAGGRQIPVEELIGIVLRHVNEIACSDQGGHADRTALTFPASWGPLRQGVLLAGAELAGIDEPMLVTEPEAAAAHYAAGRTVAPGSLIAVFDFGGGTLDIAVIHKTANGFELLGTPLGDDDLGGSNIDELIFEHVLGLLDNSQRAEVEGDPAALATLFAECIDAKEALSFDLTDDIPIVTKSGRHQIRLTRSELDSLIAPILERALHVLGRAITTAGIESSELTTVLLVGGTSRIPAVAAMVASTLNCEIAVDADPKTSVALGAAVLAQRAGGGPDQAAGDARVDLGISGLTDATLIGRGGYSVVYRARQESLDRDVAVKFITAAGFDLTARRRFVAECQTVGRLSEHPNIVNVYESAVPDDSAPYLIMAYVPAGSYQDRLDRGETLEWREAFEVGRRVAEALGVAHDEGVLHCDVKPANVLISRHEQPLLADFGLARAAERTSTQSMTGLVGTPHYSPPEVFDGALPAPTRDLYSLAATLHALIAGRPPIETDSNSVLALMRHVANDEPADLRDFGVPAPVADAIAQALAKDPSDRPQDAAAFVQLLDEATAAVDADAARHRVEADAPFVTQDERAAAVSPGKPRVLIAVALAVVLGGALLAIRPWSNDDTTADDRPATTEAPGGGAEGPTATETTAPSATSVPAPVTSPVSAETPPVTGAATTGIGSVRSYDVTPAAFTAIRADEHLWLPHGGGVTIIDTDQNVVLTTIAIEGDSETPLAFDGRVWVPSATTDIVTVVGTGGQLGEILASVQVGDRGLPLVAAGSHVWVPNRTNRSVFAIDIETYEAIEIPVGGSLDTMSSRNDQLVAVVDEQRVIVSPDGTVVPDTEPPFGAELIATGDWTWDLGVNTITRVDPASGARDEPIELEFTSAVPSEHGLWLTRRGAEPQVMFLDEHSFQVFDIPVTSNPDTPLVEGDRAFITLIQDGALVEFVRESD